MGMAQSLTKVLCFVGHITQLTSKRGWWVLYGIIYEKIYDDTDQGTEDTHISSIHNK